MNLSHNWRAGLLLTAVCLQATSCCTIPLDQQDNSLRARATRESGRWAYGIYVSGFKFGWQILETKVEHQEDREVAVLLNEQDLTVPKADKPFQWKERNYEVYQLEHNGELIRGTFDKILGTNAHHLIFQRHGSTAMLTGTKNGLPVNHRLLSLKRTLSSDLLCSDWLAAKPRKGSRIEIPIFNWDRADGNGTNCFIYQGTKDILWQREKRKVHLVSIPVGKQEIKMEMLADGTMCKMVATDMEWRLQPETVVRIGTDWAHTVNDWKPLQDFGSAIPVERNLGETEDLDLLTLELAGLGEWVPPVSRRQRVVSRTQTVTLLEVKRDSPLTEPASLSETERELYLLATPHVQADNLQVAKLAQRIAGRERAPLAIAAKLQKWISNNIRADESRRFFTASEILKTRQGTCTEHALLLVAMARSLGIPAREIGGLVYDNSPAPAFYLHAWAEIFDGKQWISMDPSRNEVLVDAGHVKLCEGVHDPQTFSWAPLLRQLKVKVLEAKATPVVRPLIRLR